HDWDSGGIFDINLRVHDIEEMYRTFLREGWNGYADPLRYTFGIYDVSEVLLKGPDDITIAIMQRFAPPLEGFEHMKTTSRIFNSSTISRDMQATHDFFINQLGFEMFFQTPGLDRKAGHNVLGFPASMNHEISVPIDIVRPDINNYGSIEYLEPQEISGKDCSHLAHPPNLGILMLRFPVKDAVAYAATLEERGVELNAPVQELMIEPYGKMKVFSVRSPDGVWLEFMELV
ncbi:MAG: VOC family protein, partial [Bacteroidota bacterium]